MGSPRACCIADVCGSELEYEQEYNVSRQDDDVAFLRRLSQDLWPDGSSQKPGESSLHCDSSDCIFCQGLQHGPFCSRAVNRRVASWLGKHSYGGDASNPLTSDPSGESSAVQQHRTAKRLKRADSTDADSIAGAPHSLLADAAAPCGGSGRDGRRAWRYKRAWDLREDPAPSELVQVAEYQSSLRVDGQGSHPCDLICGLEFSTDGRLLAAAGVSKQLRLYTCEAALDPLLQPQPQPVAVVRTCAKVAALSWDPWMDGVMAVGDYDGTLSQIHVCSGHIISELDDAHGGRKIWSVRHSHLTPHLCISASEDRSAKLWSGRALDACAATITPPCHSTVCCADFSSSNEHLVALACSSHVAYCYDLRAQAQPLAVLAGHTRPVSYVRFFGADRMVSASIDGSLACWELGPILGWQQQQHQVTGCYQQSTANASTSTNVSSSPAGRAVGCRGWMDSDQRLEQGCQGCDDEGLGGMGSTAAAAAADGRGVPSDRSGPSHSTQQAAAPARLQPWKRFTGHSNVKNFVGLAVRPEDGLLAVGSESQQVFAYHTSWSSPLATFSVPGSSSRSGGQGVVAREEFVSAVAWRPWNVTEALGLPSLLAAATSVGSIKLLSLLEPAG